jgi:phosphatidylglycerol lysyltransferase
MSIQKWLHRFGPAIAAALLAAAFWILHRELRAYRYADLAREIREMPPARVLLALALTALDYFVLTGYDALGLRYARHPLAHHRVVFASFICYAVSNNLGFALLTGASLRYRLYSRWEVPLGEIAKVVAFTATTIWLGVLAVGGAAFVVAPLPTPDFLHLPIPTLRPLGVALLGLLGLYFALSVAHRREFAVRGVRFAIPEPRMALAQVAVSALDWLLAASVLYVLLPHETVGFPTLVAVYVLGQSVGLISHVPGGVAVFESVVLLFLGASIAAPELVGILLVFRCIYYLVPLAIAATALALYEARKLRGRLAPAAPIAEWASSLVPQVMAALVFLGGVVLLLSGATPGVGSRLAWLDRVFPLAVIELSHLLASAAGVALLLLARGLQLRLNAAFHFAAALLLGGIALSLLKGLDYEEASALVLVLAGLWVSRREFYRPSALLAERFTPAWLLAVAIVIGASVWLGFFSYKHVEYSDALWWRFSPGADAPRFLRATVGAVVLLGSVAAARLLRPARPEPDLPDVADLERATEVIRRSPVSEGNVALLADKALLFSDSGSSFIMYGVEGRSRVALGDPIGPESEQRELAWRFRELCDLHAAWPVFYEVSVRTLPIFVDMGLTLSKLGEEARVALDGFSLDGGARKSLRQSMRRVEKEGCTFEIVARERVGALLPELRLISEEWLAHKSVAEKGFSLGRFDEAYLSRFPVALVRRGGRIVAFANLWLAAPGTELSVDLMRHVEDAPNGVMEYLFVQLMVWGRDQGYHWFNLGMAPLAGMEAGPHARLWNQVGGMLFRHGEHFYNFAGLRQYKEKFDPVWEPKYLASPGGLVLARVVANVSVLISGGLRRVVSR